MADTWHHLDEDIFNASIALGVGVPEGSIILKMAGRACFRALNRWDEGFFTPWDPLEITVWKGNRSTLLRPVPENGMLSARSFTKSWLMK